MIIDAMPFLSVYATAFKRTFGNIHYCLYDDKFWSTYSYSFTIAMFNTKISTKYLLEVQDPKNI